MYKTCSINFRATFFSLLWAVTGSFATIALAAEPSDTPLASGVTVAVKPNVMFVLDDSGSMNSEVVPDAYEGYDNAVGIRSAQCNLMYYNPQFEYRLPVKADGTTFPARTITAACSNGYSGSTCNTNLTTSFRAGVGYNNTNPDASNQAAYYYVYTGPQLDSNGRLDPLGNACKTKIDGTRNLNETPITYNSPIVSGGTGGGTWTRVFVSSTSGTGPVGADERANFANWYSYYRKRLMMMKAAGGLAFQAIDNKYRVGFITINPNNPVTTDKFLPIEDFDNTVQRPAWYSILYGQSTNGSTPLREALTRVGRYYAGKSDSINAGMITTAAPAKLDPVQYSCQQNFTILTTDGYWNGNGGKLIDGTSMGSSSNFDGVYGQLDANNPAGTKFSITPYPIYDGATETRTTIDKENEYQVTSIGCSPVAIGTVLQERTAQLQQSTSTLTTQTSTLQKRTGTLQVCNKGINSCNSGDWSNTSSCTWDTSGSSKRSCRYNWGSWSNATSSCTRDYETSTSNNSNWSGNGTDCQYTAWSPTTPTPVSSCTAVSQSTGNTFTVLTARTCQTQITTALHDVSSCTATTVPNGSGQTTQCAYTAFSAWSNSPACVAVPPSTGPNYTVAVAKECANNAVSVATQKLQYRTFSRTSTAVFSGTTQIGNTTTSAWTPANPSWADVAGTSCTRVDQATAPYSPVPSRRRPLAGENPLPTAPCTEWPCSTSVAGSGGSSNSLADIAQYYYVTDLRPSGTTGQGGVDVSENNVPASGSGAEDDKATWQHMTTFTLGLGLAGNLTFRPDYKSKAVTTGDFAQIREGTLNWPVPSADNPTALDDLWHAGVNGRGQFFSAADPDNVVQSLQNALAGVNNRVASAAAAATSTLEPVAGDNFAYIAKYVTGAWSGDLESHSIALANDPANNITAGQVLADTNWTASARLGAQVGNSCDSRTIKLFRAGATNNLVDFKWDTYACDAGGTPTGAAVTTLNATEQAHFGATQLAALAQYSTMTTAPVNQRTLALGAPMVNFLRGQRGNEDYEEGSATAFYRLRTSVLGDVVNAQPLYVRAPVRNYTDTGYAAFKSAQAARAPVVYLAANDGMLHAFNGAADGGDELWAFMPSVVLPDLYRLLDTGYPSNHHFYTDGSPVAGDVYDTTLAEWRTILVAGMNKGGKAYYALDVTDPASPKALWEFTDADLGYTYGNPIIAKLATGKWAVFVTSGLNNADGKGYLYVLDAVTGAIIHKISTGVGTAGTPSGLNKITIWVTGNADKDMTVNHVYAVDLLGNVWRFDVNDTIAPAGREASLITTLVDSLGNPQPISTKPVVALVGNDIYLNIGTGRYLSLEDLDDDQTQTVYGFKDSLTVPDPAGPMIPNIRSTLTKQTLTTIGTGLTAVRGFLTCQPAAAGWYVDLPDPKERVNVDMRRALGSLLVASNVPEPGACRIGGYSWLTNFSLGSGCTAGATQVSNSHTSSGSGLGGEVEVPADQIPEGMEPTEGNKLVIKVASTRAADSLVVGVSLVLIDGKILAVVQFSDGSTETIDPGVLDSTPVGRRLTWREVVQP